MELCACGQPLHYSSPEIREFIESQIRRDGPTLRVEVTGSGVWLVPRHFIALHGIRARELPKLAQRFEWKRIA